MSESIARLQARVLADYLDNKHLLNLMGDLQAIAAVANLTGSNAAQAAASASAAAGSLATQVALGLAANGVGNEPMDLPRMHMLGGSAFRQWDMAASLIANTQDATYQLTEHDSGKLILVTSGTRTHTLPVATDVWIGWCCRYRNRSGNNLTFATGSASDAINGGSAGSSITVATGSAIIEVICTGANAFEIG